VRLVNLAIWGALVACAAGLEIVGRLGVGGLSPAGRILATLRAKMAGRAALVVFWTWFGWHVFAR
jgi:hypothetical protein